MAIIIKDRNVVSDPWQWLEVAADGSLPPIPSTGDIIVPLALWRAERQALLARGGPLGVWLNSDEEPSAIAADLPLFSVVAVNFPKFGDGRGFSIGRLLRERYGWKGELRAIGDVFRDQLFFLSSCGFNAFALRAGEDVQDALGAFGDFSESYQSSVEHPLPLFRRRQPASPDGRK
jgi:uncharacterized protein (DUF934 family)